MKLNAKTKSLIVEIICLLYILLFIYAAVSKILDFQNFLVQLGKSPLLSVYAWWLSWSVPFLELIIVLMLLLQKYRTFGLFAALCLMSMFSAYIFIMLKFSSFVPCSCGGILEQLDWDSHLIFNLFFVLFATIAIELSVQNTRWMVMLKRILATVLLSTALVVLLYVSSESIMHNRNPFIRRYPQHPIMMTNTRDLKFNSYYIAGFYKDRIYLGNYTTPLELMSMDTALQNQQSIRISFDAQNILFKSVRILIRDGSFYLLDGSVPALFKGSLEDWKVNKQYNRFPHFDLAAPLDNNHILFRSSNGEKNTHLIGRFSDTEPLKILYNTQFLQKQIDGIFDTDGMLVYGEESAKAVYIYYYRNEYMVGDKNAEVVLRGNTIDTNSIAKVKVAYLKSRNERTMSTPPPTVNKHAALCGNLLFIHSNIKGKYEDNKLWDQSFAVDVYDVEKAKYVMSFVIYGIEKKKLRSFCVTPTHLYALIDDQLVVHEIRKILKKEFHFEQQKDSK